MVRAYQQETSKVADKKTTNFSRDSPKSQTEPLLDMFESSKNINSLPSLPSWTEASNKQDLLSQIDIKIEEHLQQKVYPKIDAIMKKIAEIEEWNQLPSKDLLEQ